jgi:hypothetical protein
MNYQPFKKEELIEKLQQKDEYIVKADLMLKKANEATKAAIESCAQMQRENQELIGLRNRVQAQDTQIKQLQAQPKGTEILEATIKAKDAIIAKLGGYIDSYISATQEVTQVLRGVVNMSDNAYKNILDEIKRG